MCTDLDHRVIAVLLRCPDGHRRAEPSEDDHSRVDRVRRGSGRLDEGADVGAAVLPDHLLAQMEGDIGIAEESGGGVNEGHYLIG